MSSARSKKQDNLQELRSGSVQRLSQHFLQTLPSQPAAKPPSSSSPVIRFQPLVIPPTFKPDSRSASPSPPPPPPPSSLPPTSSSSLSSIHVSRGSVTATTTTTMTATTALHSRHPSAPPQFTLRPASPIVAFPSPLPPSSAPRLFTAHPPPPIPQPTPPSLPPPVGFAYSKDLAGGLSLSSVGSEDSFVSAVSYLDSPREPGSPRTSRVPLWKQMLDAIEQEDRPELDRILHALDFAIVVQTLVTWNMSNTDNKYRHDPDVLLDATELLGATVDHLNLIQIACLLFNEEMALDLLNFVAKASDELESRKILYEFMGKMWGDGNTTLHLASFLGMADLTKRLLDLGANVYKMNDRKYKPVDCADENTTRSLFLNLTEGKIPQESLPTSPVSDAGSDVYWNSFHSMGHLRSTSTSTLPLSMLTSDELHHGRGQQQQQQQHYHHYEKNHAEVSFLRPTSSLGLASQLGGLLITGQGVPGTSYTESKPNNSPSYVDSLSMQESGPLQSHQEEAESILSPVLIFQSASSSSSSMTGAISISDTTSSTTTTTRTKGDASEIDSTSSHLNVDSTGDSGDRIQRHRSSTTTPTTTTTGTSSSPSTTASTSSSSYNSHIRPTLRSYQSSPSIRLCIKKSTTRDAYTTTPSKKSKGSSSTKHVSFDPRSLMADASRTGDLALYKSMLAVLATDGKAGTMEEIVNYQSASRRLSSLHLAASYKHLALCRFLVETGANVNLTDMEEGHLAVFEFLVKQPDADLQAATIDGELLEDVVEDDEVRQRVIDIIEASSRG
ncbi:hypothetical protein BGZ99_005360 [Dissophora globulifera]|uniref:Uncharacterized protein n=1 Tax=Dissophora globulifera TaxID=979702 RepID=A0A9P6UTI5_9FUNG|nr:hypothetical protein BGZ99_005360 [Dissophora globulifera]